MRGLLVAILIFICAACATTKYVDKPVPIEVVKTEYVNQLYRDSIFIHDSINHYTQGDTVYQYKYKYIYKYMNRIDTLVKTDSIEVPVEIKTVETKEVNKLKWYQSFLIFLGIGCLAILGYRLIRFIKNITNKTN